VYTPCFVRDGAEWHPDSGSPAPDAGAPGVLTVDVAGNLCRVRWAAGSPAAVATNATIRAIVLINSDGSYLIEGLPIEWLPIECSPGRSARG